MPCCAGWARPGSAWWQDLVGGDGAEWCQQQGVAVPVPFIPPLRTLQCESSLGALLGVLEVWANRFPCLSSSGVQAGTLLALHPPPSKHQCWVLVGFCWAGGSIRFAFPSPALQAVLLPASPCPLASQHRRVLHHLPLALRDSPTCHLHHHPCHLRSWPTRRRVSPRRRMSHGELESQPSRKQSICHLSLCLQGRTSPGITGDKGTW